MELSQAILDIAAGPFGSNLKVECFVPEGFPIVDGANLKGVKLTDNITKFVTEEKARSLARSIAKRGDVVVTISGNVGQISYIPEDSAYEEYLVSQRQFRATMDKNIIDVPYLVYYFHTKVGRNKILSFANQTGVPALAQPLKNFRKIELDLPDLATQRRISSILSSLDRKIELNNEINATLEEMAQALFKSWFVDFEPFKNGNFIDTEIGKIPEGWRVAKAEDIYKINIGKTPPRKEPQWFSNDSTDNVWVSIADMGSCGAFISDSSEYLTDEAVNKHNVIMVDEGTVLLSFKLTIGRVAIAATRLTTNEAIARFILPDASHLEFLYLCLKQYNYAALGSTSSIATAVNSKTIKAMPLLIPSDRALQEFSTIVAPMFERIKKLSQESLTLTHLRDTLLPRLMSGEIEV